MERELPAAAAEKNPLASVFLFALTIVVSAFLLFQVQPLIAKLILPWFGGSAAVWTSCMLFFQVTLLAGYGYAHWLTGQPRGRQPLIHVGLLALSLLSLPIMPSIRWKPSGTEDPLLGILGLLAVTAGLPYFLLSSTSPLLQSLYSRARGGAMPWRLFALSNAGSMAGLLSYPILVEPLLTNHAQAWTWSAGYAGFALLCSGVAFGARKAPGIAPSLTFEGTKTPVRGERLLWIALAAAPSALLLAATTHITENIAAIPFLWVAPLSLYLLSFILCFDSHRWYRRGLFAALGVFAIPVFVYSLATGLHDWKIGSSVALLCAAAFVLFMISHGELARRRPDPSRLTSFYLMISTGGAIGGLFVGFAAPYLFNALYDLHIVLALMACLFAVLIWQDRRAYNGDTPSGIFRARRDGLAALLLLLLLLVWILLRLSAESSVTAGPFFRRENDAFILAAGGLILLYLLARTTHSGKAAKAVAGAALALALAVAGVLANTEWVALHRSQALARNFYGALMVYDRPSYGLMGDARNLSHGTIKHGEQFLRPEYRKFPTTYYASDSGIGLTVRTLMKDGPVHVGVIGLGAGTMAAYARPIDRYRFYEINPLVVDLNRKWFTFLSDCSAPYDIVLGDARLSLEREPPQQFDVLVVDAFSGDAIPIHLLTREAFGLYWRHLKPRGVLAVHVSNTYLSLAPVVLMAAIEGNRTAMTVIHGGDIAKEEASSEWVLVSAARDFFETAEIRSVARMIDPVPELKMWSDDFSNLYRILR